MQSNNEPIQENAMFDMRRTGALISVLRRKVGLTQAELAEKLGISYQAVSSWERGASMPDIGKLVDLARALNTTVDHLLTGENEETTEQPAEPKAPEAPKDIQPEPETPEAPEAPQDTQPDVETPEAKTGGGLTSLIALAPFLDQETLDRAALEAGDIDDPTLLGSLAPFLSEKTLEQLVWKNSAMPMNLSALCCLAPFLPSHTLSALAERCDAGTDGSLIAGLAPFLTQETVKRLYARFRGEKREDAADKGVALTSKSVRMLIENCDSEEIPELAKQLGDSLNDDAISRLIECCDSDLIPDLAQALGDRLDDEAIRTLIDHCDSEMIPELAKAIRDHLNEEHMQRLIECCDSDMLMELTKVISGRLNKSVAGDLLRKLKE